MRGARRVSDRGGARLIWSPRPAKENRRKVERPALTDQAGEGGADQADYADTGPVHMHGLERRRLPHRPVSLRIHAIPARAASSSHRPQTPESGFVCARCDRWRITSCWRRSISHPCSHTASDATDFCWFRICFHNYAAKTPSLNVRLAQGDEP